MTYSHIETATPVTRGGGDSTPPRGPSSNDGDHHYDAHFEGTGEKFFEIAVVNWVLTMLTLGLYAAWAKVRTYRYFYGSTHLAGEPFRFTGKPTSLFKGILIAGLFLATLQLVFNLLFTAIQSDLASVALLVAYVLLLAYLGHYAYFRSRRYRFAHTTYREIRFRLGGSPSEFAWQCLLRLTGAIVTFGIMFPAYRNYMHKYIYNNLRFGNVRFRYSGRDDDYFGVVVPGFLLTVLTLGIYYFWWYPRVYTFFVEHLHVGRSRLHTAPITPEDLFSLRASNYLITACTLGIGAPLAQVRTARFFVDRIRIEGSTSLDDVLQTRRQSASSWGEGLADGLDMDVDLGF
jgi:uncharacterized membrane protein YjgN (DUF898 family)